jgi:hypothetical protein
MRVLSLVLALTVLTGLALRPATARAADAAELFERGVREFGQARFKDSLKTLESARAAAEEAPLLSRIHLYLGLGHAVLGERGQARSDFATALQHDPTIKLDRGQFNDELVSLLDEVRRGLKGELVVTCARPGATVAVDGQPAVPLPYRSELVIGKHRVEVRGPDGAVLLSQAVTVAPKATVSLHAGPAAAALQPSAPAAAPEAPARAPKRRRVWTWVLGGTGVALLAAGLGVWASAGPMTDRKVSDDRSCVNDDPRPACGQLLGDIRRREDIGYSMIGIGAALAATSVVVYFLEGHSREARRAQVAPMLAPSMAGAVLRAAF